MAHKHEAKKSGMVTTEVDKMIDRIATHNDVEGVIVCSREGIPMNTTMDSTATTLYLEGMMALEKRSSAMIRQIDPTNELLFLRLTSRKFNISLAPRSDHIGVTIQRRMLQ